ncbi:FAD-dependent monooxygenase [Nocardiopsis algeriensis]|uniref:Salicylate hydroxylase n=1 Tax=Nocardiopsis algeriensis TaxID=1478215 RepID=A0A841ISJ5_9ACTN|nr:FAD-dependent monooxygenase [Nocardiopsis algeriensis]MBB6119168.1 salicylate hydroxylase [Nocardiopsis algeriensis]
MSEVHRTDPGSSHEVVVVGGGIGGLGTALALTREGRSVRLLERADSFGEVGAGLQLGPNATRILREWGLLDKVRAAGVEPRRLVFRDALTDEVLTELDLGQEFQERYGAPYVVLHRSDLHSILLEACREAGVLLETGRTVTGVENTEDTAYTQLADGTVLESDVVVAADGLRSTLRGQIVDDEPVGSGYVAYRGTVPLAEGDPVPDDVVAWVGPGCHFVRYALRQGDMLNLVAVFRSPAFDRGESEWGGPDELDAAFGDCSDTVRSALAHLWRDRWWPMADREPASEWVKGRTVLTGDAAHPMLQYLAQGACQALEDAHTLAELSTGQEWAKALASFAERRIPRTARVQTTARMWGDIWHVDGVARVMRNELFRTRDRSDYKYTDWLYAP